MKTYYHNHHIIPKHMGGSDNPDNIIKLTVQEHAKSHKILWEKYGKKEDEIAWRMLSGQITPYEATIEAIRNSSKKTCEKRNKENNPMWDPKNVEKAKKNIKKFWDNNPELKKEVSKRSKMINTGKRRTEEQKENYRNAKLGKHYPTSKRKCSCLGCKKETTTQAFYRVHLKKCFE